MSYVSAQTGRYSESRLLDLSLGMKKLPLLKREDIAERREFDNRHDVVKNRALVERLAEQGDAGAAMALYKEDQTYELKMENL